METEIVGGLRGACPWPSALYRLSFSVHGPLDVEPTTYSADSGLTLTHHTSHFAFADHVIIFFFFFTIFKLISHHTFHVLHSVQHNHCPPGETD